MPVPYKLIYSLDGQIIDNPIELFSTSIEIAFGDNAQGSIETGKLTFVNEAYTIIQNRIKEGLNGGVGITEGLDFKIDLQEGLENTNLFDGLLDFRTLEALKGDDIDINEPKYLCEILEKDGSNNLTERLQGLTFASLESQGVITSKDYQKVKYVVEKQVTFVEQALLALAIFLMIKELRESIYRLADQVATIATLLIAGAPIPAASLLYAVLAAAFEAAYIFVIGNALADLIIQFKENLLPTVRRFNGINYRTALNKIFEYLGYTLVVSSGQMEKDLSEWVYLPSKAEGRSDKGIPFDSDFGFVAMEFVSLVLDKFRAEIFVQEQGGKQVVNIRTKKDPFLLSQSTYVLPNVLEKPFSYNLDELKESRFISFTSDISDEYTVDNWEGTSIVVTTTPQTQRNPKNNLLKGLETKRIPLALGSKKTELSTIELVLIAFLESANFVLEALGKPPEDPIDERLNILKISQPFFGTPKVLKMKGSKLANKYRSDLSAPYLWDQYLNYDSFVQNNFKRQRKVFTDVLIPFSFDDYKKVTKNSYFITENGERGKFTSLEWIIEADKAEVSFWIEEVYTKNLREETTIVK